MGIIIYLIAIEISVLVIMLYNKIWYGTFIAHGLRKNIENVAIPLFIMAPAILVMPPFRYSTAYAIDTLPLSTPFVWFATVHSVSVLPFIFRRMCVDVLSNETTKECVLFFILMMWILTFLVFILLVAAAYALTTL